MSHVLEPYLPVSVPVRARVNCTRIDAFGAAKCPISNAVTLFWLMQVTPWIPRSNQLGSSYIFIRCAAVCYERQHTSSSHKSSGPSLSSFSVRQCLGRFLNECTNRRSLRNLPCEILLDRETMKMHHHKYKFTAVEARRHNRTLLRRASTRSPLTRNYVQRRK
jgi:hypothetical protein